MKWSSVHLIVSAASLLAASFPLVSVLRRTDKPPSELALRDRSGNLRIHLVADTDEGAGISMFDENARLRLAAQENTGTTGLLVGASDDSQVSLLEMGLPSVTVYSKGKSEAAAMSIFGGAALNLQSMDGGGSIGLLQNDPSSISIQHDRNLVSFSLTDRGDGAPGADGSLSVSRIETATSAGITYLDPASIRSTEQQGAPK